MLKRASGDNSLGQTQTYDWYKRFKIRRTSTDDDINEYQKNFSEQSAAGSQGRRSSMSRLSKHYDNLDIW
jgi:hypothetical protein